MHPENHFSVWRVLVEASKLLTVHQRLMLPIILISLAFSSIHFLFNYLFMSPLLMDLFVDLYAIHSTRSDGLDHSSFQATLNKDIKIMAIIQCLFFAISFIIYAFLTIAMINATSLIHLGRHVTLMELFLRLRRSWKGPTVTQLHVSGLDLSCKLIIMGLFGISLYIFSDYKILIALIITIALLALHFYIKLIMIWSLSSVVSVVEEGLHGMEAVTRAKELIKVKRRQCIVITLLVAMASSVIFVLYTLSLQVALLSSLHQLANGLVMAIASVLVNLYSVMIYVVIYYECKKSCGEEEMPMKGKFVYNEDCVPNSTSETELLDFHD